MNAVANHTVSNWETYKQTLKDGAADAARYGVNVVGKQAFYATLGNYFFSNKLSVTFAVPTAIYHTIFGCVDTALTKAAERCNIDKKWTLVEKCASALTSLAITTAVVDNLGIFPIKYGAAVNTVGSIVIGNASKILIPLLFKGAADGLYWINNTEFFAKVDPASKIQVAEKKSEVVELTAENFDKTIEKGLTLVDFYKGDHECSQCKNLSNTIEEFVGELKGVARVAKVNKDHSKEIAARFELEENALPTVILFKDGVRVKGFIGYPDRAELLKCIISAGIQAQEQA